MFNSGNTGLEPVLISEINHCNFSIPAYQRGYRWQRQQVYQLLNDIVESDEGVPYYLQPIVVARTAENSYDLIDGQQRVTALMTAIAGIPVVNANYKKERIKIAFNPFEALSEDKDAEPLTQQQKSHIIGVQSNVWREYIPDNDHLEYMVYEFHSIHLQEL